MSSQSLAKLQVRLRDIDQLLDAHSALTKFKKAEAAAKNSTGLSRVASVVNALVSSPGKGRPAEVDAINRAAFVLLCAHFQGFVEDLHQELGEKLLMGRVDKDTVKKIITLAKQRNTNPHPDVIEKMFGGLGVFEVMADIKWQKCSNKAVRTRLTGYIETRNKIAHGSKEKVTKQKVQQFKAFVENLAEKLDISVRECSIRFTGKDPWCKPDCTAPQ